MNPHKLVFLALRVLKSRFFGFSSINCQDSDPVAEGKKSIFRLQPEQQGSLSSVTFHKFSFHFPALPLPSPLDLTT
jgi:hypothetical protein